MKVFKQILRWCDRWFPVAVNIGLGALCLAGGAAVVLEGDIKSNWGVVTILAILTVLFIRMGIKEFKEGPYEI